MGQTRRFKPEYSGTKHRAQHKSPVAPARVSESARIKAGTKLTSDWLPVHRLTTLLADLATLTLNEVAIPAWRGYRFPLMSEPTPLQTRAFQLMDIDPTGIVPSTSPAWYQILL